MPDGYKVVRGGRVVVPRVPTTPVVPRGISLGISGPTPPPRTATAPRRLAPSGAGFSQTATPETYQVGPGFINPVNAQVPETLPVMGSGFTATATPEYYQQTVGDFLTMYLSGLKSPLVDKYPRLMKTSPKEDISRDKINKPKLTIGAAGFGGGGGGGGIPVSLSGPKGQLIMWRIGF